MQVGIWLKIKNNMKLIGRALICAVSASLFLTACSGGGNFKNSLYYNNYTGADTEGYGFIKIVAVESAFQQKEASSIGNTQLAEEIKQTYAGIAKSIYELGDREDVLMPDLIDIQYVSNSNEAAMLIKSQEIVIGQFKRVLHNTNVKIADYAKDNLPKLEELLSKTKSGQ